MSFRQGAFAKVWEVKPANNGYINARISTSKKIDEKNYDTDFSGWVSIKDGGSIKDGDRIKITDCAVTNKYVKEKDITYTNFNIYKYEMADGSAPKKNNDTGFQNIPADIDESLPFN